MIFKIWKVTKLSDNVVQINRSISHKMEKNPKKTPPLLITQKSLNERIKERIKDETNFKSWDLCELSLKKQVQFRRTLKWCWSSQTRSVRPSVRPSALSWQSETGSGRRHSLRKLPLFFSNYINWTGILKLYSSCNKKKFDVICMNECV